MSSKAKPTADLQPLEYLLAMMRDETLPMDVRFEAAKAAAPFCHHALQSITHTGDPDSPIRVEVAPSAENGLAGKLAEGIMFSVTPRKH